MNLWQKALKLFLMDYLANEHTHYPHRLHLDHYRCRQFTFPAGFPRGARGTGTGGRGRWDCPRLWVSLRAGDEPSNGLLSTAISQRRGKARFQTLFQKWDSAEFTNRKKTIHPLSPCVSFIYSALHFFLSSVGQGVAAKWEWGRPLLIYLTKDGEKTEKEELTAVTERKREGIPDRWPAASLWKVSFRYISHNPRHVSTYHYCPHRTAQ